MKLSPIYRSVREIQSAMTAAEVVVGVNMVTPETSLKIKYIYRHMCLYVCDWTSVMVSVNCYISCNESGRTREQERKRQNKVLPHNQ